MAKMLTVSVKFGMRLAFLLSAMGAHAESERCVPAADGGWHCGKDVTEADAAPLPEPQSRSLPPVMLIDPARFGEGDIEMDAPPPEASSAEPAVREAQIADAAQAASPATAQIPPALEKPAAMNKPVRIAEPNALPSGEPSPTVGGNFSVQLAVASSPRGFDALLAKLGAAARNSQRRQLANGAWVLLIGNFNSIAAARNAIPSSIPGAFARDTSTLNFK